MSTSLKRLEDALGDRYRVERPLGEGGMAEVYLAVDVRHDRQVAIKVLKPELAAAIGAERFLAEIRTTAHLRHPHILPLFDSGEADGLLFYVMPFVEGESLRARLDREKQLPVDEARRIAEAVAGALDHAHRQGIVHRDVKPANILLQDGQPVVADFGIALAVTAAGGPRLTGTGLSLGTPQYMSPEQATGDQRVGPASDIYALGCVLYEMLVGEAPFTGATAQAVLGRIITGTVDSVAEHRPSVPLHVDGAVARALEKLPADRFASAADFARALGDEGFRYDPRHPAAAVSRRSGKGAKVGWAFAAVFGAACLGLLFSRSNPPPPEVRRYGLEVPDGIRPSPDLAITPDGSALVLAGAGEALELLRLDDRTRRPIPGTEGGSWPAVSPDGSRLAFASPQGLRVSSLDGGAPITLVEDDPSRTQWLHWDADGYIYFHNDRRIRRVPADGGPSEAVLQWEEAGYPNRFLPVGANGRGIASVAYGGPDSLFWVDGETGARRALGHGVAPLLVDHRYLIYATDRGSLEVALLDPESGEFAEGPVDLGEPVGIFDITPHQDAGLAISTSGDLVTWDFTIDGAVGDPVWVGRDGNATGAPGPDAIEDIESMELSPAGDRIAYSTGDEIWILDLDDGSARRVTAYEGTNRRPVWSPDGRSIAFISDRTGRRAAYSLLVDGIAEPEPLLAIPGEDVDEVAWSPTGDWLVYRTGTGARPGDRDLYARRIRPDTLTIVVSADTTLNETSPTLSPDGRWIAYVSDEGREFGVWVRPFPDVRSGRRRVSIGPATEPVWSSSGDELFYRTPDGLVAVSITDRDAFSTGRERILFPDSTYETFAANHRRYAYDGRSDRFLMVRNARTEPRDVALVLQPGFLARVKARFGG